MIPIGGGIFALMNLIALFSACAAIWGISIYMRYQLSPAFRLAYRARVWRNGIGSALLGVLSLPTLWTLPTMIDSYWNDWQRQRWDQQFTNTRMALEADDLDAFKEALAQCARCLNMPADLHHAGYKKYDEYIAAAHAAHATRVASYLQELNSQEKAGPARQGWAVVEMPPARK